MTAITPESPILETPKWLEALEKKRNRPHRLAHEIGAGAPCLVCGSGCKGLNLHFWRKLCTECKCRKEDHDVLDEDEDYAQFEILFGAKKVKRTTLKFNKQNKMFDWIPPNITPELAVEYLNALPENKLPMSDSEGAKYRKQQLERQLPRHDVDPSSCHDLTDKELQEFNQYLDNLRNNVIGQGRVLKYGRPDMYSEKLLPYGEQNRVAKGEDLSRNYAQMAGIQGRLKRDRIGDINMVSSQQIQSESFPIESDLKTTNFSDSIASGEYRNVPVGSSYPAYLIHSQNRNERTMAEPETAGALKGPRPFVSSANHAGQNPFHETTENINRPFGLKKPSEFVTTSQLCESDKQNNNPDVDSIFNGNTEPASVLNDVLSRINELNVASTQVPFVAVSESQTLQRKPGLRPARTDEVQGDFPPAPPVEEGLAAFPEPPATCAQCYQLLTPDDIVVEAERAGDSALWHARCFVCHSCGELLVDLMYFFHKGNVFCGRHYAELLNIPRCFACDELIFMKEYTCAEEESFHIRHFCCYHCDEPLANKQYIPKDGQPVCLNCYQLKYGKNCRTCWQPITAGEQRVSWKELDFHAAPQCFRCGHCKKSLLGGRFVVKDDETFCSKECVQSFTK